MTLGLSEHEVKLAIALFMDNKGHGKIEPNQISFVLKRDNHTESNEFEGAVIDLDYTAPVPVEPGKKKKKNAVTFGQRA